jgi:hypothetical protein
MDLGSFGLARWIQMVWQDGSRWFGKMDPDGLARWIQMVWQDGFRILWFGKMDLGLNALARCIQDDPLVWQDGSRILWFGKVDLYQLKASLTNSHQ